MNRIRLRTFTNRWQQNVEIFLDAVEARQLRAVARNRDSRVGQREAERSGESQRQVTELRTLCELIEHALRHGPALVRVEMSQRFLVVLHQIG